MKQQIRSKSAIYSWRQSHSLARYSCTTQVETMQGVPYRLNIFRQVSL